MKQVIVLLLLSYSSLLFAQSKQEKEIRAILTQQQDAWNKADLPGFMAHYWRNDSLQFVSKKSIKKGWQAVYDGYQKNYVAKNEMGVLTFHIFSVEACSKKDAIVVGSWKVQNTSGNSEGYFTLWFKKIKDKWVIVLDHTS
jgi:ketosteroid isomerase-like protein